MHYVLPIFLEDIKFSNLCCFNLKINFFSNNLKVNVDVFKKDPPFKELCLIHSSTFKIFVCAKIMKKHFFFSLKIVIFQSRFLFEIDAQKLKTVFSYFPILTKFKRVPLRIEHLRFSLKSNLKLHRPSLSAPSLNTY